MSVIIASKGDPKPVKTRKPRTASTEKKKQSEAETAGEEKKGN